MDPTSAIAYRFLTEGGAKVEQGFVLGKNVPWRAHLHERKQRRAWYCHDDAPESDGWLERLRKVRAMLPRQRLGVAGPAEVLMSDKILAAIDELEASALPMYMEAQSLLPSTGVKASACEFIYEDKLRLSSQTSKTILDRNLSRALKEKNSNRKGVLFEVVTAVLLSQVNGFEVKSRGISNRTQQMDVAVENKNTSGVLSRSEIVLAEAKNWSDKAGVPEYIAFLRKLKTRYGRSNLGFLVVTEAASTISIERLRDSQGDVLVVILDSKQLPKIWSHPRRSITQMIEEAVFEAACT